MFALGQVGVDAAIGRVEQSLRQERGLFNFKYKTCVSFCSFDKGNTRLIARGFYG